MGPHAQTADTDDSAWEAPCDCLPCIHVMEPYEELISILLISISFFKHDLGAQRAGRVVDLSAQIH